MIWKTFKEAHPGWNIKILIRLDNDDKTIEEVQLCSEFDQDKNVPNIVKSNNWKKSITIPKDKNEKRPILYWSYKN